MYWTAKYWRTLPTIVWSLIGLSLGTAFAQPAGGPCKYVSERTGEAGCWIIAHDLVGALTQSPVFWHLDIYPARTGAEATKGRTQL